MPSGCQPFGSAITSGNDAFASAADEVRTATNAVRSRMRRIGTPFESVLPASVIPDTGVRGHYGAVPPAPRSARPARSIAMPHQPTSRAAGGLRSWAYGRGADRPMALGGPLLQDARR